MAKVAYDYGAQKPPPSQITPPQPLLSLPSQAGWQTYESEEFGYSIAYPPDWRLFTARDEERKRSEWLEVDLRFYGPKQHPDDYLLKDGIVIQISHFRNDNELPLSQWLDANPPEVPISEGETETYPVQSVTKHGVQGLRRLEDCTDCPGGRVSYYFPLKKVILRFSFGATNTDPFIRDQYKLLSETVYDRFRLMPSDR